MKSKVLFIINGDKMQNNSNYEADQNKKLYLGGTYRSRSSSESWWIISAASKAVYACFDLPWVAENEYEYLKMNTLHCNVSTLKFYVGSNINSNPEDRTFFHLPFFKIKRFYLPKTR